MSTFMDLLNSLGYALDTPGALTRGALLGRPGERASGDDLAKALGVGHIPGAGFALDTVVDPTNLFGAGLFKNAPRAAKFATAAAQARNLRREMAANRLAEITSHAASMKRGPVKILDAVPGTTVEDFATQMLRKEVARGTASPNRAGVAVKGAIADLARNIGSKAYIYDRPAAAGQFGFMYKKRPDAFFVARHDPHNMLGTAAHEAIHQLDTNYPDSFAALKAAIGDPAVEKHSLRYWGSPDKQLEMAFTKGDRIVTEEGVTKLIGDSIKHHFAQPSGEERLLSAITGQATRSVPRLGVLSGSQNLDAIRSALTGFEPSIHDPDAAARIVADWFNGAHRQRHALIPTGTAETVSRSFAPAASASPADVLLAAQRIENPYRFAAHRNRPSLAAALGLYNASKLLRPGESQ